MTGPYAYVPLRRFLEEISDGPFGSSLKSSHYSDDGARVIRLGNIGEARFKSDDEAFISLEYFGELQKHSVESGDLLIAGLGDLNNPVGRACLAPEGLGPAIVKADCFRARLDERRLLHRFAEWALNSRVVGQQVLTFTKGSTRARINLAVAKAIEIPVPPREEQGRIADYLDRETARIDTLIEEQQRLIEMLRERRWAVVERGVALLEWDTPLKSVATLVQTGPFGSQLKSDEYEDGGVPVINPSHIVAGEIAPDPRIAVSVEKAKHLARHKLEEGDLIAARRGDLGRCAVVGPSAAGFLCGTGSALIRFDKARMDSSFAAILFGSQRNREALALASVGSTMDNLNSDIIGALRFPVPRLDEQRELTADLKSAAAKIDSLIDETEQFILLSKERRSALITAAVTGQIDVREMV